VSLFRAFTFRFPVFQSLTQGEITIPLLKAPHGAARQLKGGMHPMPAPPLWKKSMDAPN